MIDQEQRIGLVEQMTIHPKVIEGSNQELFMATYKHYVERHLVGDKPISESALRTFEKNLQSRQKIATDMGAQFIHMVAPDKQSVYRDQTNIPDLLRLGEVYRQRTQATFFYPLEPLLAATHAAERMYFKNDLHWNAKGVLLVLELLLQQLGHPDVESVMTQLEQKVVCKPNSVLGLGALLTPPRAEDADMFNWKNAGIKKASNHKSGDGQMLLVKNEQALQRRVLAFGDSFMLSMIYALSHAYSDILFVRSHFFHEDLMRDYQPDILITSSAEGYLCKVMADRHALPMPAFIEKHGSIDRYDAGLRTCLKRFLPDQPVTAISV